VIETLDALVDTDVKICAEIMMTIHHNLLANCTLEEIEKIYSKPEVFAQCRTAGLDVQGGKYVAVASTAEVADVAEAYAAIGSRSPPVYGLEVVCENIEDISNNVTRFLVVSREDARPTGEDKTSAIFSTAHKSGALADVLEVFRKYSINLTNIQSRPSKKREWEYIFLVDFLGHRLDERIQAGRRARQHCLQLSVLGSFPRATELL
jgi:chorismate mutase/prephenate dehydratase